MAEETEMRPGRRCIWLDQAEQQIRKIYEKRNEKRKNGISNGMPRIQFEKISPVSNGETSKSEFEMGAELEENR